METVRFDVWCHPSVAQDVLDMLYDIRAAAGDAGRLQSKGTRVMELRIGSSNTGWVYMMN